MIGPTVINTPRPPVDETVDEQSVDALEVDELDVVQLAFECLPGCIRHQLGLTHVAQRGQLVPDVDVEHIALVHTRPGCRIGDQIGSELSDGAS